MQTTVTTSVKLRWRNTARNGPAKPHIPGLRRPHTRQTGASALVSRPQEGHRMAPEVLRNIAGDVVGAGLRLDTVALVEPGPEVDQTALEGAEGPVRIAAPDRPRAAGGAADSPVVSLAPGFPGR